MRIKSLSSVSHGVRHIVEDADPVTIERLRKLEQYARLRAAGVSPTLCLARIDCSMATYYRWRARYGKALSRDRGLRIGAATVGAY